MRDWLLGPFALQAGIGRNEHQWAFGIELLLGGELCGDSHRDLVGLHVELGPFGAGIYLSIEV